MFCSAEEAMCTYFTQNQQLLEACQRRFPLKPKRKKAQMPTQT